MAELYNVNTTTTTTEGSVIFDGSGEDNDDDDDDDDPADFMDAVKVWVPIALTLGLVLLICFAMIRAKTKRRQQREAGTSDPMRAVSGGVAMNVNVYRNYGVYVNQLQQQQQQGGNREGITPQQALQTIPYYNDAPPSYEDTMKMTGTINESFSASQECITSQMPEVNPPPYSSANAQPDTPAESVSGQVSSASVQEPITNQAAAANPPDLHSGSGQSATANIHDLQVAQESSTSLEPSALSNSVQDTHTNTTTSSIPEANTSREQES